MQGEEAENYYLYDVDAKCLHAGNLFNVKFKIQIVIAKMWINFERSGNKVNLKQFLPDGPLEDDLHMKGMQRMKPCSMG